MFVDADDEIYPNDFDNIIDLANKYNVDLVKGFMITNHKKDQTVSTAIFPDLQTALNNVYFNQQPVKYALAKADWYFEQLIFQDFSPNFTAYLYRRSLLIENKHFFDETLAVGEDFLFISSLFIKHKEINILEISLLFYLYTLRECSVSKSNTLNGFYDLFKIYHTLKKQAKNNELDSHYLYYLALKIHAMAFLQFYLKMDKKQKELITPLLSKDTINQLREYKKILFEQHYINIIEFDDMINEINHLLS